MKFTIITPVYNGAKYISETIESIIFQKGDFEIEYIVVDGGSTDETVAIAEEYRKTIAERGHLVKCQGVAMKIISESDNGMYDAINKGFSHATGDVYAYLNADDIYLPSALNTMASAFEKFPEVHWLKGVTSYINEQSTLYKTGECYLYDRAWIGQGLYGTIGYFIQQDSVFWKASLWEKSGGLDPSLKLAGDFYLWKLFARHASLYSLNVQVSCFRRREEQLSSNMESYYAEVAKIQSGDLPGIMTRMSQAFYFKVLWRSRQKFWKIYELVFFRENVYRWIEVDEETMVMHTTHSMIRGD